MSSHNHAALPEGRDIALLSLGVVGIGTSGPLIALSAMPIPSLIFWRNLGGAISMLPFAIGRREWKSSEQRAALRWSAISGVILAFHFIGFFLAMRLTSVAAGTALTAMQPIFTAIFLRIRGAQIPRKAWLGMFVAFISVLSITGVDWQISFRSFTGDMAAIVGAALAAIYMLIGSKAQRILSTSTYTTVCYGICAFTSLPIALIIGYPVVGFALKQWLIVIGLVVGAQLLGHTMFNFSLKRVSPAVVSLVVFFEVPVSAILAFWWLGQRPPAGTIPGIVGLLIGCAIFVRKTEPVN